MNETLLDEKLMAEYEAIRIQEQKLIIDLMKVLPKIDRLEDKQVSQVRDAMFHADHPFLLVFIGPFNAGKSSLINALLGKNDLLTIGATPTTDRICILRYGDDTQKMDSGSDVDSVFYPSNLLKKVSFVDTPGLESVFQTHEDTTRKFLHRSDAVLLVMLATQAMTAKNLEVLQTFKEYGKKVVIVVNQSDLLSKDQRDEVQQYVREQSKDKLGFKPDVWMVSAKKGLQAYQGDSRDEALWKESGLYQIENYINKQLGDAARLRQKLQTPLQIVQNVHQAAISAVRENQAALDHYQSINENIDQQLETQKREQQKSIRETNDVIQEKFAATIENSGLAIRDTFRFTRAFRSIGRGLMELFSFFRLFRRNDRSSYTLQAFKKYGVFSPVEELPGIVDKLGPRLEGQDMQDIDNLVQYGQQEIKALPEDLRDKVIGTIQAPLQYDRSALQDTRPKLEDIEEQAKVIETESLEDILRNTLLYLASWELIVIILLVIWFSLSKTIEDSGLALALVILILSMGLIGFLLMPVRGRIVHTAYTNRLLKLQAEYVEKLSEASDKQVEYGIQLRKDAISPLTHLIEAQTEIQNQQFTKLQSTEQQIAEIESNLNALGKRKILGISL